MSRYLKPVVVAVTTLSVALPACRALGQRPLAADADSARARRVLYEAPVLLSDLEDRERLAQLLEGAPSGGFVVRSLSSRLPTPAAGAGVGVRVLAPELFSVVNTTMPFSLNDGAMWAGRGVNLTLRFGAAARVRGVHVLIAPELVSIENKRFADVDESQWWRPPLDTPRFSPFASPWNKAPFSADLPFRPGAAPVTRLLPGQSALWVGAGTIELGVATENQWWGPGVHDALVLTNSAPGFPHAFVRTARPLRTRLGDVEARWLVGVLTESPYFDTLSANDHRSLAAASVTLVPRWDPGLTLGLARAVYAPTRHGWWQAGLRWLDVFQPTDRPNARSWSDTSFTNGRDQITSLFARWVFPRAGTEVYGEVGRAEWPASLRDLLVDPTHTMGYLLGAQSARRFGSSRVSWQAQGEFTFLERSSSWRYRPTQSWYTSRATPQGYTHLGQPLGAGIGPGSSHQLLAYDVFGPSWRAGLFAARWRLNADWNGANAFPLGTGSCEYDTTLYWGVRAGSRSRFGVARIEALFGDRYNYLFQNNSGCPRGAHMRDVRLSSVRLNVTPLGFR